MENQTKLSPYNSEKELYLVIDGASSIRTGFVLLQRVKEMDPEAGFLIINAGSSLLPPTKGEFSPVEIEAIALDRACTGCHQGPYYAEKYNSYQIALESSIC